MAANKKQLVASHLEHDFPFLFGFELPYSYYILDLFISYYFVQITFWVRNGSKGFTWDCRSRTRAMLFVDLTDLCCMLPRQPQPTARPLTILPTVSRLDYAEAD